MEKILVIQQEECAATIQLHLEKAGYEVLKAPGSREGINALKEKEIDLLIFDVDTDGENPTEFIKSVRWTNKNSELIVIAAMSNYSEAVKCLKAGANDLLMKPLDTTHLDFAVNRALMKKILKREIKEESEFNRRIIDSSMDGILVTNLQGRITDCNPAYEKMIGYTKEELLKMSINTLICQKDRALNIQSAKEIMRTDVLSSIKLSHLSKDGREIPLQLRCSAIKDENGDVISFMAIVRNLTTEEETHKRMTDALTEKSSIMNTIPDIVYTLDMKQRIVDWNTNMEIITGFTAEELSGKPSEEMFPERMRDFAAYAIKDGYFNRLSPVELPILKKDGTEVPYQWKAAPMKNNQGEIVGLCGIGRDLTEIKESEEKLKASERKYSNVVERANDGIVVIQDHVFKYVNSSFMALVKYSEDELLEKDFEELIATHSVVKVKENYTNRMRGKRVPNFYETVLLDRDGHELPVEVNAGIIEHEGRPADLVFLRDLSERKVAEESLRKSEERYRSILESIDEGYHEVDLGGSFTFFNEPMRRTLGYSREDMIGLNYREFMDEENARRVYEAYNRVYRTGKPEKVIYYDTITQHGEKKYVEGSVYLMRDEKDTPIGFRGTCRDITDRKRAEQALRLAQEEKLALIEQTTEAIVSVGMDGRIEVANPAAEILFGRSANELKSVSLESVLSSSVLISFLKQGTFERTQTNGEIKDAEAIAIHPDGSQIPAMLNAAIRKDSQGRVSGLIMAISDTREQKRMQQELMDLAHQSGMAEIATGVLHNVNNVLTSVNLSSELIQENLRQSRINGLEKAVGLIEENVDRFDCFLANDPKGKVLVDYIRKATDTVAKERNRNLEKIDKLLEYINQVKELISMQQSYARFGGVKEQVDPAQILDDALGMHASAFERNNVRILKQYSEVPLITVDRQKLIQALLNLVKNAREALFSAEDKGDLVLKLQIDACENGTGKILVISVEDNGPGIAEEHLERVFEYGFTTKDYGNGFGLHATALSIKDMGGEISVRSEGKGMGTAFVVEIPY
ncbi:MAG: PAS domain S-box protein [Thermodesulfobacteriota bacterium]|nr:PAS domain S-box protein [Thermodesulfobacteriota bacterium]